MLFCCFCSFHFPKTPIRYSRSLRLEWNHITKAGHTNCAPFRQSTVQISLSTVDKTFRSPFRVTQALTKPHKNKAPHKVKSWYTGHSVARWPSIISAKMHLPSHELLWADLTNKSFRPYFQISCDSRVSIYNPYVKFMRSVDSHKIVIWSSILKQLPRKYC